MTVQQPDPRRSLSIKGLMPGLVERGKIKIGIKGRTTESGRGKEFQPPQKLDHFIVTTLQRAPDGNFVRDEAVHARIGDRPTEIPIRLLYDDSELDFQSRYVCFRGKTMWCSGDANMHRACVTPIAWIGRSCSARVLWRTPRIRIRTASSAR